MRTQTVLLLVIATIIVKAAEPNPPVWPESVKIIEAGDSSAQSIIDNIYYMNGGHSPSCNGQFSSHRFALLFKPGQHNLRVNVGYYTQVMGLGSSPYDTKIQQVTCENGDYNFQVGALDNFWRSVENFYVNPKERWNNVDNSMLWAVSQASPMRRVVVDGNLQLYQYNYGDAAGYASGGFMSDVLVTGTTYSGSQQQFMVRNSHFGQWNGVLWNHVFVGSSGVPQSACQNGGTSGTVNIPQTPVISEKPFIVFENGRYYLAVPNLKSGSQGPSNYNDLQKIDFSQVYVATDKDSADTINAKLAQGLHLVLTPGIYHLTKSIVVTRPNTIILGLGLATLISESGNSVITVQNVEGVRVAGLLLEAGKQTTDALLQWGQGNFGGSAGNPGILQDLFVRVGGPNDPNEYEVHAERQVQINSGNVILDDLWLWRADHHVAGITRNSKNSNRVGIEVNGDNVIAYGLAVEHTLEDLVRWNGNNGKVYFYQSELPYDVNQQNFGDKKFVSYRVGDSVTSHEGYGIGVYTYFADNEVTVENAVQTPNRSGIKFQNLLTVFLNGKGQVNHIINGQGESIHGPNFMIKYQCQFQGNSVSFLEQ